MVHLCVFVNVDDSPFGKNIYLVFNKTLYITIYGTGDPKGLASGISEALVTTEFGLIVAIPILVVHGLLSRMARQKIGQLEQVAISFVNGIHCIQNKDS